MLRSMLLLIIMNSAWLLYQSKEEAKVFLTFLNYKVFSGWIEMGKYHTNTVVVGPGGGGLAASGSVCGGNVEFI